MDTEEIVIIGIVLAIIAKLAYERVYSDFLQTKADIIHLIYSLNNWKTYLILIILTIPFIFYLNYRIGLRISQKIQRKRKDRKEKESQIKQIEKAIKEDIDYFNYEEIKDFISLLKEKLDILEDYKEFAIFENPLKDKLFETKKLKIEAQHEINLFELKSQEQQLKNDIRELEMQKQDRIRSEEQEQKAILNRLNVEENPVFKKEELNDIEFKALLKKGYAQTNQYCVIENRLITALVKQILNHSATHTFLVWNVKQLLKNNKDIYEIEEHLTKDADITFKYKGKTFAIEIETGTLLEKHKQMLEKMTYLKRKYGNRFMILVSNKDLYWEYRKLGFSTQRNEVEKNLLKMLNSG